MRSLILLSAAALALAACGDGGPDREPSRINEPDQDLQIDAEGGNEVTVVDCDATPDRAPCREVDRKPAIQPPEAN